MLLAIVIFALLSRSAYLKRCINDGMRELWQLSLGRLEPEQAVTYVGRFDRGPTGGIYAVRSHRACQSFFQWLKWRTIPGVFGLSILVGGILLAAILVLIGAQRGHIAWTERTNQHCALTRDPPEASGPIAKTFDTREKCWTSGVGVTKDRRYRIALRVKDAWIDRTIPTSPCGFESGRLRWYARPMVLLRRSLSGRWYQPMLKIVPASGRGGHITMIAAQCCCEGSVYSAEFTAARTGEVALFVNDVMPLFFGRLLAENSELRDLYLNNRGTAEVILTPLPDAPAAGEPRN